jgi:hypothetical protein
MILTSRVFFARTGICFTRKRYRTSHDICIASKKQARKQACSTEDEFRLADARTGSAPVAMVVVPIIMMMAIRPPVAMMMMRAPVAMMRAPMAMVMMTPLHVGRQLAGVALRGGGDARTDRRCRLRLLCGSRDNQKRAESGKS